MSLPRHAFRLVLLASLAVVSGCGRGNDAGDKPTPTPTPSPSPQSAATTVVPTQLPTNARPAHYAIAVTPDAANLRFAGTATIDVDVLAATDSITLNAADLEFQSVAIADAQSRSLDGQPAIDAAKQTATFTFPEKLADGRHVLTIHYSGTIYTHATGLFALDYDSADGRKRALYTQFEASDARRFFPCWDEPNFRAPFDLRVTIPAGQQAVSNMPEAARAEQPDGTVEVRFATTPAMSSYLLFMAVGEFDRITATAGATEVGVVTKKGDGEKGRYALQGE
ncbi:MAG: M1 family peptidase, partial [Verrucomicrobiota bacterium]|nr:M1 family peptidase [Verrucomicrobiota bacterium]